jgi:hypothetical protein
MAPSLGGFLMGPHELTTIQRIGLETGVHLRTANGLLALDVLPRTRMGVTAVGASRASQSAEAGNIGGVVVAAEKDKTYGTPSRSKEARDTRKINREARKMLDKQRQVSGAREKRSGAVVRAAKSGAGRRGLLTDSLAAKIVGYVLDGNFISVAAQAVGVHKSTVSTWRSRAQEWADAPIEEVPEEERIYVDFFHAVAIAEAQAEVSLLRQVAAGAFGWQAAMQVLERRHPDRWKRRDTVEHEGGDPNRPIRSVSVPSDDKRAQEVANILTTAEAVKASSGGTNGRG